MPQGRSGQRGLSHVRSVEAAHLLDTKPVLEKNIDADSRTQPAIGGSDFTRKPGSTFRRNQDRRATLPRLSLLLSPGGPRRPLSPLRRAGSHRRSRGRRREVTPQSNNRAGVSSARAEPLELGALPPNPQSFLGHRGIALGVTVEGGEAVRLPRTDTRRHPIRLSLGEMASTRAPLRPAGRRGGYSPGSWQSSG